MCDTHSILCSKILEKITNLVNSSLTSDYSRGFQLSPNGPEFERKWYGEC